MSDDELDIYFMRGGPQQSESGGDSSNAKAWKARALKAEAKLAKLRAASPQSGEGWQQVLDEMTRLMQPTHTGRYRDAAETWNLLLTFIRARIAYKPPVLPVPSQETSQEPKR